MKKLVLFDVDGILIAQSKSNVPSISKILIERHFGIIIDPKLSHVDGMTDRNVLITRLKSAGIKNPESHPKFESGMKEFAVVTKELVKEYGIENIFGVEDFIKKLLKEKITIGLLTGNTKERAKIKLSAVNLWHYFKFGAFGGSTKIRSELVGIALKEAKEKTGISFSNKNVFLVGDTVRDIQCAKSAGVKCIAVATGKQLIKELKKEKPDHLFKDFKDVEAIMYVIK